MLHNQSVLNFSFNVSKNFGTSTACATFYQGRSDRGSLGLIRDVDLGLLRTHNEQVSDF